MKKHLLSLVFCIVFMALVTCSGCSSSSGGGTKAGTTNLKTYIASTISGDMGLELVSRFNNVVASYDASDASSDVVNYVVMGSDLENDLDVAHQAVYHIMNNKNIIILSPNYEQVKQFYQLISNIVHSYEKTKEANGDYSIGSSGVEQFVNQFRLAETEQDLENLLNAYADRGDAPILDILGFRGNHVYCAEVDDAEVVETEQGEEEPDIPEASKDVSEDVDLTAETETESREALISDGCVEWINDYNSSSETQAALAADGQALLSSNSAGGTSGPKLDKPQEITRNLTADASVASDGLERAKARIKIQDKVWAYHNFDTSHDYVLVEQNITYYNGDYKCNDSSDNDCWDSGYGFSDMYGPYFKSSTISNVLCSETKLLGKWNIPVVVPDVKLHDANPITSSGSTSYSTGLNFNLGGNFSATPSGPTGGISTGISWSETTTPTKLDMSTVREDQYNGTMPQWTFNGNTPGWHWRPLWISNKHDQAPLTLRKQFDARTNWVWQIEKTADKNSYKFWTRLIAENEILTKGGRRYWRRNTWRLCNPLNIPFRYRTTLTSFLSCDNTERRAALEAYLKQKITSYKDSYDISVIKDPASNLYYLKQNAAATLGEIEKVMKNLKSEIQAAGFSDVGKCTISLKAPSISDEVLGSFTIDLSE